MERNKKAQTEQWVEDVVYGFFEQQRQSGIFPTPQEVTGIIPFLLMHQNIQVAQLLQQIDSFWQLFFHGEASIQVTNGRHALDVNVKESSPNTTDGET